MFFSTSIIPFKFTLIIELVIFQFFKLFLLKLEFNCLCKLLNILWLAHFVEFFNMHLVAPNFEVRYKLIMHTFHGILVNLGCVQPTLVPAFYFLI
jgi:hypothetical protein